MVFGTIYETHIPTVSLSHENKADYFNRKQCYNSNTQVVTVVIQFFILSAQVFLKALIILDRSGSHLSTNSKMEIFQEIKLK